MLPWKPTNPTSEEVASIPAFVTQFNPMDVFMGRGTPSVRHEGNIFFRQLINQGKGQYATCETNTEKDALARGVVEAVASRNGRFLQKITTRSQAAALGVPHFVRDAWVYASEEAVLIKVKQCFRDLFKKSEQQAEAGLANPPIRSHSSTTQSPSRNYYSRGDTLGAEGAAAAAAAASAASNVPVAAVSGLTPSSTSSHDAQRAAVINQLLRNQQQQQLYALPSSVASMPTSNEPSPLLALLQHQHQRNRIVFEQKLIAKANADTVLRKHQEQQMRNQQAAAADGIINSVLGQPSPQQDAARIMSWQAAVQAAAAASSGTIPSSLTNSARSTGDGMEDTPIRSSNQEDRPRRTTGPPPPLSSDERAHLAREVQSQKLQIEGNSGSKDDKNQQQQQRSRSNSALALGQPSGNETAAMLSFLQAQQRGQQPQPQNSNPPPPQQQESTLGQQQDTGTAVMTAAVSLGLSTLSSVLGMPSDSLPSTIDDAQQKIQAARWVVAQLLMASRSGGDQTTTTTANSSHQNYLSSSSTTQQQPPPLFNVAADDDDDDDEPPADDRVAAPPEQNVPQSLSAQDERKPPPYDQFSRSNSSSSGGDLVAAAAADNGADGKEAHKPTVAARKRSRDESEHSDHGGDDADSNKKLQPMP